MPNAEKMKIIDSIESLKEGAAPVIIFGAGIAGEALLLACGAASIRVECFCDNNFNKTRLPFGGLRVLHVPELPRSYPDAAFLISAADLADVVDQLSGMGYTKLYSGAPLLRHFDIGSHAFSAPYDFVEYAVATYLLCHDSYLQPSKMFLRSVDIIITERCSRRCRDCSNLMQYYENPKDCDIGDIIRNIDALCDAVDEINEFRVIGGEPLMNKDFHRVVAHLTAQPKVKKVVIYTNGTQLPNERQLADLKNPKVLFIITDYGAASKKLERLKMLLSRNGTAFYVTKAGGWSDCAGIVRHNRPMEERKAVFGSCCARNTFTLTKDRIFRCPFSANAYRLAALPDFEADYVVIVSPKESKSPAIVKQEIKKFISRKNFIEACDYCNGRPFGAPEIVPGVQAPHPLPYEKHRWENDIHNSLV